MHRAFPCNPRMISDKGGLPGISFRVRPNQFDLIGILAKQTVIECHELRKALYYNRRDDGHDRY